MAKVYRVSVLLVSYNTKALTLQALKSLYRETPSIDLQVIVVDNASTDGSAKAIKEEFPNVELIESSANLGFAKANNLAARRAFGEWLLLLNPDTIVLNRAVEKIVEFAESRPDNGIYGGRTVFPDGRLNPGSCWMRITVWSTICISFGLHRAFPNSIIFNSESIGGWNRDGVREVDVVQGSFFLIRKDLWEILNGFDCRYFMYGEEADLCLRAIEFGYQPIVNSEAEIVHLSGAASKTNSDKQKLVSQGRAALIRDHWPKRSVRFGIFLMVAGAGLRAFSFRALAWVNPQKFAARAQSSKELWLSRSFWTQGYS